MRISVRVRRWVGAGEVDPASPWGLAAWGGVVGPVVFVADWAILGAGRAGYSPVDNPISRLAEFGASTRPAMTGGFVVYGVGLLSYGVALRRAVPGPAWRFAVGTGIAILGVAAFPLGSSTSAVHGVCAVLGYVGLAALPVAVSWPLVAAGHRTAGRLSVVAGAVTGAFLLASTTVGSAHGLTQRVGLTVGDAWVAISAIFLLRSTRQADWRAGRRTNVGGTAT
jgi:hypothetical membrane protein